MRPTLRVRGNAVVRGLAGLCRQYLRWYGNGTHRAHKNGEDWLLRALAPELRVIIDAGANVGKWAVTAAAAAPAAEIHAFEIVPATAEQLTARVTPFPRIHAHPFGLSEREGTVTVQYRPQASTHSSVTDYPHTTPAIPTACRVMAGDTFLTQEGITRVDLLKLDVEGAEHLVLRGVQEALRARKIRFIQFEYGKVNILTHFLLRDFHAFFAEHGYVVGKLFPDHVDFRPYELRDEDFLGPNYLACAAEDPLIPRLGAH